MSYETQVSRANPGLFFFIVAQSESMDEPFGSQHAGQSKAAYAASTLNRFIKDLVIMCTKDTDLRNYCDVGLIGYGSIVGPAFTGALAAHEIWPIVRIADHPISIDEEPRWIPDEAGRLVEMPVRMPVWIKPVATGQSRMCGAFDAAHACIAKWVENHPDSYPPIVVHITDGRATDGNPVPKAKRLASLGTRDGRVLIFNCHITSGGEEPIQFPPPGVKLVDDFARLLYDMSSELPPAMLRDVRYNLRRQLPKGTRGFTFQADMTALLQFIQIGTRAPQDWTSAR